MLNRTDAQPPDRSSAALARRPAGGRRRRALVTCAALALVIHATFLDRFGISVPGSAESSVAPMSLRTMTAEEGDTNAGEPPAPPSRVEPPPTVSPPMPPARPRLPRRAREPVAAASSISKMLEEASADTSCNTTDVADPASGAVASPAATVRADADLPPAPAAPTESASPPGEPPVAGSAPAGAAPAGSRPPLVAAGEQPPPLYRTQLPPPATLHYEVRRGVLRGDGEIRWQPAGDGYRIVLEARVAGLTLLTQSSEGGLDGNGLAPVRFLDQRARRSAQAANFRRDAGTITFSGSGIEWPLLAGSQDRLSWMVQLAAIAAAEPQLLAEGGRITMVVVGARGDAGIWTLRYGGHESVKTAAGPVAAIKLVREGRSAYDTNAEIWLDPERSYLPVHATLRNSSGAVEYELLLERIEPAP